MEYASGRIGRVFAARFHDGEPVYAGIEEIARREKVESAVVVALGGVRRGRVIVGPRQPDGPLETIIRSFDDAREIVAVGSIHSSDGRPALHLHGAIGRGDEVIAGCPREGLDTFLLLEVFLIEVTGLGACRRLDERTALRILAFANPVEVKVPPR